MIPKLYARIYYPHNCSGSLLIVHRIRYLLQPQAGFRKTFHVLQIYQFHQAQFRGMLLDASIHRRLVNAIRRVHFPGQLQGYTTSRTIRTLIHSPYSNSFLDIFKRA